MFFNLEKELLHQDIQAFIDKNLKGNIHNLVLKGIPFDKALHQKIIEQIESRAKSEKKLPTWFRTTQIYYPKKLSVEQTSSEITAAYKASLVNGDKLLDVTGGFGVDTYYFSKKISNVTHCEIDVELSAIATHNFKVLKATNIKCLNENGIDALKRIDEAFEWIYVDPSRRNSEKKKVFLLSDCTPNVKTFQGLFLKYASNVLIKTSPLLDIKLTLTQLKFVKVIHVVAVNNEVKELLWVLEKEYTNIPLIKTVNFEKNQIQKFDFKLEDETESSIYSAPQDYLYEPNVAILKAGAFESVAKKFNINKIHKHSHLYTSNQLIDFPGRQFKIKKNIPFSKKALSKENILKANITTRNFPISVSDLRKKFKLKDGGDVYLFFTTDYEGKKIILKCIKT